MRPASNSSAVHSSISAEQRRTYSGNGLFSSPSGGVCESATAYKMRTSSHMNHTKTIEGHIFLKTTEEGMLPQSRGADSFLPYRGEMESKTNYSKNRAHTKTEESFKNVPALPIANFPTDLSKRIAPQQQLSENTEEHNKSCNNELSSHISTISTKNLATSDEHSQKLRREYPNYLHEDKTSRPQQILGEQENVRLKLQKITSPKSTSGDYSAQAENGIPSVDQIRQLSKDVAAAVYSREKSSKHSVEVVATSLPEGKTISATRVSPVNTSLPVDPPDNTGGSTKDAQQFSSVSEGNCTTSKITSS